ncbi:hypothetical protein GCM10007423_54450 [Dyadobacter endophyticus]|uniref:Uncharacterized protein n=1 Tax=Dyadobacter endophyticus TaxID=1749036 RepID=A0ABQ1Z8U9_9BACT|nr:hypothetical protein [Dyadobacter endophyticus]GGH51219.1 hypothetical protein GCM10007423_54450 [Dyadobacter endophyticus]
MEKLVPGVTLILDDNQYMDRVSLSLGSVAGKADKYHSCSYIPAREWRRITTDEIPVVRSFNSERCQLGNGIKIHKLPESIINLCKEMEFDRVLDRRDIVKKYESHGHLFKDFDDEMEHFLYSFDTIDDEKPVVHAFPIVTKGLETVTKRYINGVEEYLFCGMHIDSDSGNTIGESIGARNRVSINLTSEPRHLLYVNVSSEDLINRYRTLFNISANMDTDRDTLVRSFFENNPKYPIVRLTIRPYEMYIAPTENLIHDASTLDRELEDITMVALGKFVVN